MSEPHAPKNGPGNALFKLGRRRCPDCHEPGTELDYSPKINKNGDCEECGAHFPVIGGDDE